MGLPNVGKSTIFNALTRGGAKVDKYPFTTIDPNRGKVAVPDERLEKLKDFLGVDSFIPCEIEFVDIAGLIKGASKGEGLGNQFLAHIRDVDLILHVIRGFPSPDVPHPSPELNPREDVEIVNLELLLSDLEIAEKILKKLSGKDGEKKRELITKIKEALEKGIPLRNLNLKEEEVKEISGYGFITLKPQAYLLNLGEGEVPSPIKEVREILSGEKVLEVYGKLEEELSLLSPEEREEFRKEWGIEEKGLEKVIRVCYDMLSLITFYTMVRGKLRAWELEKGKTILAAARKIHSDMEKGFIKGEVIPVEELLKFEDFHTAKEKGAVKIVGRDYPVQDGDIIFIHFRP